MHHFICVVPNSSSCCKSNQNTFSFINAWIGSTSKRERTHFKVFFHCYLLLIFQQYFTKNINGSQPTNHKCCQTPSMWSVFDFIWCRAATSNYFHYQLIYRLFSSIHLVFKIVKYAHHEFPDPIDLFKHNRTQRCSIYYHRRIRSPNHIETLEPVTQKNQ